MSRHERSNSTPPFRVALGYEAIFRVPVSELFPGAYGTMKQAIEIRLAKMEHDLQQSGVKGRAAAMIARKLEWMWERRNPDKPNSLHALGLA